LANNFSTNKYPDKVLKQDGWSLKYASEELKKDNEVTQI
jgi:hypothetical protein